MQPQNPITQQIFNETVKAAISGKSREAVILNMRQKGIPTQTAESIASQAFRLKKKLFQRQGMKFILGGSFMLVIGVVITGFSYFIASTGLLGNSFIITGGFIVGGVIFIIKGLFKVMIS